VDEDSKPQLQQNRPLLVVVIAPRAGWVNTGRIGNLVKRQQISRSNLEKHDNYLTFSLPESGCGLGVFLFPLPSELLHDSISTCKLPTTVKLGGGNPTLTAGA
jgi:hypothetical protein